jgi:hypothetical protein
VVLSDPGGFSRDPKKTTSVEGRGAFELAYRARIFLLAILADFLDYTAQLFFLGLLNAGQTNLS